jgi:hypothetical protein
MSRKLILSIALAAFIPLGVRSAELTNVNGQVFVNKGFGYEPVGSSLQVSPGDRIRTREGGAQIVYKNGYVQTIEQGQIGLILANPPGAESANLNSGTAPNASGVPLRPSVQTLSVAPRPLGP